LILFSIGSTCTAGVITLIRQVDRWLQLLAVLGIIMHVVVGCWDFLDCDNDVRMYLYIFIGSDTRQPLMCGKAWKVTRYSPNLQEHEECERMSASRPLTCNNPQELLTEWIPKREQTLPARALHSIATLTLSLLIPLNLSRPTSHTPHSTTLANSRTQTSQPLTPLNLSTKHACVYYYHKKKITCPAS
jgi:hypothetical protein